MKIERIVVLLVLLALSDGVFAQGVPIGNGIYACDGTAQAGPCQPEADDYGDTSAPSPMRWADRWGAIAADKNAVYGIVVDMTSKGEARKAAIAECKRRGGDDCDVLLAYNNQCAAVAAGNSVSRIRSRAYEEEAIAAAISDCEAAGEGACRVYYSGCSLPVRVQ